MGKQGHPAARVSTSTAQADDPTAPPTGKFKGNFDDLRTILRMMGADGFWIRVRPGHWQFRRRGDRAVLNWWRHTVYFEGPPDAATEFFNEFAASAGNLFTAKPGRNPT